MTAYLVSEDSSDIISETEYNQHKSIKVLKNKFKKYLVAWVNKKRNQSKAEASVVIRAKVNGFLNRNFL
jgi:hypothetical protein